MAGGLDQKDPKILDCSQEKEGRRKGQSEIEKGDKEMRKCVGEGYQVGVRRLGFTERRYS